MTFRWRWIVFAVVLICAVAAGAPFIGADRFAEAIREGLESKLGRRVDIRGDVRFRVFPRPGFSVEDPNGGSAVVIHELPSIGIEPVAYVERLDVSVALGSLLSGSVELAGIRLVNPSVNLMRVAGEGWNLQPLIRQALGKGSFPEIEVTGGRLNFKTGDVKSVIYLAATDLVVAADLSDPSRFGIRVEGDPARTDAGTRAFGRLTGRGMLTWPAGTAPGAARLDLSLSVDRTGIAEIASLAAGRRVAVNGFVASRFHLEGPLSDLAIEGTVELDQVERAVLFARPGSGLSLKGRLRFDEGQLRMETADAGGAPVTAQLSVESLFAEPRWALLFGLRDVPAASLRLILAEAGYAELARLPVEGLVNGSLGWSTPGSPSGTFSLTNATIAQRPPVAVASAEIVVANQKVELHPTEVRIGRETMTASAEWRLDSGGREVRLQTAGMPARDLRRLTQEVLRAPAPWMLEWGGNWSGALSMRQAAAGQSGIAEASWSGPLRVTGAQFALLESSNVVVVDTASVSLRGAAWSIRDAQARLGDTPVRFDYSSDGTMAIRLGQADLADLEAIVHLLAANSQRRSRPYRSGSGRIAVSSLTAGRLRGAGLRARFYWTGPRLELRDVAGSVEGAPLAGSMIVDLAGSAPLYSGHLTVRGISWQLGSLDVEGDFEAAGKGSEVLPSLRWQGAFAAEDVKPVGSRIWDRAAGCFVYGGATGGPRLRLTAVEVASGDAVYLGRGAAGSDGRLRLELESVAEERGPAVRLTGRVTALGVEVVGPAGAEKAASKQD